MKKLIIGAVAMAVGLVAQAGSFNWSYASSQTELDAGYHVYVILGSTVDTSTWKGASDVAALSISDSAVKTSGKSKAAYGTADTASITSYDQQAIFVLVNGADGDQYKITDAQTIGETYVMLGQETGKAKFPVTFGGEWKDFGGSPTPPGPGPDPVPEPTSGLLLVLGMAGLALRRRRA